MTKKSNLNNSKTLVQCDQNGVVFYNNEIDEFYELTLYIIDRSKFKLNPFHTQKQNISQNINNVKEAMNIIVKKVSENYYLEVVTGKLIPVAKQTDKDNFSISSPVFVKSNEGRKVTSVELRKYKRDRRYRKEFKEHLNEWFDCGNRTYQEIKEKTRRELYTTIKNKVNGLNIPSSVGELNIEDLFEVDLYMIDPNNFKVSLTKSKKENINFSRITATSTNTVIVKRDILGNFREIITGREIPAYRYRINDGVLYQLTLSDSPVFIQEFDTQVNEHVTKERLEQYLANTDAFDQIAYLNYIFEQGEQIYKNAHESAKEEVIARIRNIGRKNN